MDYAENYVNSMAKMTREGNKEILKSSWSTVIDKHGQGQLVLDIGCGDGSSTMQVLKPFLGDDVRLEASDISVSMVQYAKQKYLDDGVNFFVWDVQDVMLAKDMANKYDQAYSFLCLHYVQDLRKALKNIYDILKPGGSFFFVMIPHLDFLEAWRNVVLYPNWTTYLKETDLNQFNAPFQNEPDPVRACSDLMKECGFKKVEVKRSTVILKLDSWVHFAGLAKFSDRLSDKLPEELRENFMKDYVEELKNVDNFVSEKKDKYGQPYLAVLEKGASKEIIGYGVKPCF